jgi:hypothetical protein
MSFLILWQVPAPDHTNVATRPSRRLPARKHLGPPTAGHMRKGAFYTEARASVPSNLNAIVRIALGEDVRLRPDIGIPPVFHEAGRGWLAHAHLARMRGRVIP